MLDKKQLSVVNKTKSLGFIVNSKLDASDHVRNVVGKIYATLRNLRLSADFTPLETKKKLVKQLIVPMIAYFSNIYCKLDHDSFNKLQVALNQASRYVYKLNRLDHVSVYTKSILGCDLARFFDLRNCYFLQKLILCQKPQYLYEKLSFCRSNRNFNLVIPKYNYLASSRLFFVGAIRAYNSLPQKIKKIQELNTFKRETNSFFNNNNSSNTNLVQVPY